MEKIEDATEDGRVQQAAPGSREPSPSGSALTGFDPSRGLHILQHSLGVDQYGRGTQYRNYFVTGEGSVDYPDCRALVDAGLMTRQKGGQLTGGDDAFFVTDAGKRYVSTNSPAPPKLTRSQQRYQRYVDADSDLSFREWLTRDRDAAPRKAEGFEAVGQQPGPEGIAQPQSATPKDQ